MYDREIDEAIKHCLETYERLRKEKCEMCAAEHKQLAGWLTELKQLRNQNAKLTNEIAELKRDLKLDN